MQKKDLRYCNAYSNIIPSRGKEPKKPSDETNKNQITTMKTIETKTLSGNKITITVTYNKTVVAMPWKDGSIVNVEVTRRNMPTPKGNMDMLVGNHKGQKCGCGVSAEVFVQIEYLKREIIEENCPGYYELKEKSDTLELLIEKSSYVMDQIVKTGKGQPIDYTAAKADRAACAAQYPRAAALLRAQGMIYMSNYKASAAGRDAEKMLLEGGDLDKAVEIMENWA